MQTDRGLSASGPWTYFRASRRRLVYAVTILLVWFLPGFSTAALPVPDTFDATNLDRESLKLAGEWGIVPNQFLEPGSWRELESAINETVSVPELGPAKLSRMGIQIGTGVWDVVGAGERRA